MQAERWVQNSSLHRGSVFRTLIFSPNSLQCYFFPLPLDMVVLKRNLVSTRTDHPVGWALVNPSVSDKLVFSWVLGYFFCLSLIPEFGSEWVTVHFDSVLIHQNQVSYKWWKSSVCGVQAAWRHQPHAKSLLVARQPCRRNRFSATGSLFSRGGIH